MRLVNKLITVLLHLSGLAEGGVVHVFVQHSDYKVTVINSRGTDGENEVIVCSISEFIVVITRRRHEWVE